MKTYPNGSRFRWASRLLTAYAFVSLLDLLLNGQGLYLTSHLLTAADATMASFDRVFGLVVTLQGALFLACGSAFLLWWHRSLVNLKNLGVDITGDPQWAVVSWFVPIVTWFVPYRFTEQMANDSVKAAPNLPFWWAAWVVGTLLNRFGTHRYEKAATPDQYREAFVIFCAADVCMILAAVLVLSIMKFVQERQLRLSAAQRRVGSPAPVI